jgi:hypothetical protein
MVTAWKNKCYYVAFLEFIEDFVVVAINMLT